MNAKLSKNLKGGAGLRSENSCGKLHALLTERESFPERGSLPLKSISYSQPPRGISRSARAKFIKKSLNQTCQALHVIPTYQNRRIQRGDLRTLSSRPISRLFCSRFDVARTQLLYDMLWKLLQNTKLPGHFGRII